MYDKIRNNVKKIESLWWVFIIILLIIMLVSMNIRLSPLPNLIDSTTGRYLPSALDPFYFMRASEHILSGGKLNDVDNMRYLGTGPYSTELLSYANVALYNVYSIFYDVDFRFVNVISPVIYFGAAIFIFYFLMLRLLKNRYGAIISTACLAFTPLFLQRTAAGFSDHEAIGILFFFISLYYMIDFFNEIKSQPMWVIYVRKYLFFPSAMVLTFYSWGGMSRMLFIIYPTFFFLMNMKFILARKQSGGDTFEDNYYLTEFIITFIMLNVIVYIISLFGGISYTTFFNAYILFYMGIALQFMVGYTIISYIVYKIFSKKIDDDTLPILSFSVTSIIGFVTILFTGKLITIIKFIQSPLLKSRIGQTVAENQAISLLNLQNHVGYFFFIMFIISSLFILYPFIVGLIDWYYKKNNMIGFIDKKYYFYLTFLIVSLYSFNSSVRLMFLNSIFLSMFVGLVVKETFDLYYKDSKTLKTLYRTLSAFFLLLIITMSLFSVYTYYVQSSTQTKHIGPSANTDWQQAMKWVRENTTKGSLFIHWWDYGYWIQTLGERPTVTDGGHATTYWDHLIGRYLLTTPNPESAYQLMNSYGVDYLLIDPSDIQKYSAYSSIGDDYPDTDDRTSYIAQFIKQPQATQEFSNYTVLYYTGQLIFDEDYAVNNYYLPAYKSGVVQLTVNINNDGTFGNITGVAVDKNGVKIPVRFRYLYYDNKLYDFGSGYEGVIRLVASYDTNTNKIDKMGGAILLTPRVMNSFFAQTYILDNHKYLKVAYEGKTYSDDKFLFVNGRLIGPITIYKLLNNPYGVNAGFLELKGEYSAFDSEYY